MFKRGFKAQCERRSVELRKQLNLSPIAPLNANNLANHLSVTVKNASKIPGVSKKDLQQLTEVDSDSWSAFTMQQGIHYLVIFNPSQSLPRINSVVMHELSHILLGHELARATTTDDGYLTPSHYDQNQEDEADWLGGTLLLPRPALMAIRSKNMKKQEASEFYNVSKDMLSWRIRMTGVDYQLRRSRS